MKGQVKIFKEKDFLRHLFNITTRLPALKTVKEIMVFLIDYFHQNISGLNIDFIYNPIPMEEFFFITRETGLKEQKIEPDLLPSLKGSAGSLDPVTLTGDELSYLGKPPDAQVVSYPLLYKDVCYGNLLLNRGKEQEGIISFELKYLNVLVDMVANSMQNLDNYLQQKAENNKKAILIRELTRTDKRLQAFEADLAELQKNEASIQILPKLFHKLKNMLTPILGYCQILLLKIKDPEFTRRLEKIEHNTNKLTSCLNLLKDHFVRSEVRVAKSDLNLLIKKMNGFFTGIKERNGIQIEFSLDPDLPDIHLNPVTIETLIKNLCQNAVEAIRAKNTPGGMIRIRTDNLSDKIRLSIGDNGVGIKKEDLDLVATPFFSTYADKPGIGLTICENIIGNHQGSYHIESIPNQFTRIEMEFPVSPAKPETAPDELEGDFESSKKILIIHDREHKESVIDLIKDVLENEPGLDIINTSSEGAAVQYLQSGEFQLVIMDLNSSKIKINSQINQLLKKSIKNDQILFINSDDSAEDDTGALENFNIPVFGKPFEIMKIKNQIFNKLKQR